MRVLLIRPPINRFRPSFLGTQSPLNLMYLSSALTECGIDCSILDFEADPFSEQKLIARIAEHEPELVGVTAFTCTIGNASHIGKIVKREWPDMPTVLGGIHVSALPERSLKEFPEFDYLFVGEGEASFPEFCARLDKGAVDTSCEINIPGFCYRKADGTYQITPPRLIEDLDSLEFPDRRFTLEKGTGTKGLETRKEKRYAEILTSRGCPYKCSFCAVSVIHRTTRFRSVENVVREIELLRHEYGINHIDIIDSTFTVRKERAQAIACTIGQAGITFNCNAVVNTVDYEMLETFARNGCTKISFGIESGSRHIMDLVSKKTDPARIIRAITDARRAGIPVIECTYIIGIHPDETENDINETETLMRTLDADVSVVSLGIPFPGTAMHEQFLSEGLIPEESDWDSYAFFNVRPAIRTKYVSAERLVKLQKSMMRRFYFSPKRILRNLGRIRSPGQLLNSIKAAIGLIR